MQRKFWQQRSLDQLKNELSSAQWESLCDGCARCCLHKVEDDESGAIALTCVSCRLLDAESCRCSDYPNRKERVPECVEIDPRNEQTMASLPQSCAYRRLAQGEPLPDWHPLLTGDADSVHRAGISMRGRVVSEDQVDLALLEEYAFEE
jgi:uncharacterized cysteine cluster protein YcgN (CxxCxxCC family)